MKTLEKVESDEELEWGGVKKETSLSLVLQVGDFV